MRKHLGILMALIAVMMTAAVSVPGTNAAHAEAVSVFAASHALGAPSLDAAISEATWGKPVASVNKNSYNTTLMEHGGQTPEDVEMDVYFRWDADNLYIGVKTPDGDLTGYRENYVGDGLQFKLEAGKTLTGAASDICLTWGSNSFDPTVGGESFKVRGANDAALNASIRFNEVYEDGALSLMLAIPHKDMGYTAAEVKAGAPYAISILRISGKGGVGASEDTAYAGWLEWGAYWPADNGYHRPTCVANNLIVLSDEAFLPGNMFAASHALGAPSLDAAISEATWGKPVASVNKNSYNTTLMEHGGQTPEDVEMDVYFRWDADNLYIGVKTPDGDLTGYRENYVGDGLQFKLEAGKTLTGAASDICLTWGSNSFDPTVGGESFKVRGANDAALNASIRFNEVYEDGALSLMLAIPHKDMGYTAAEVKAGAPYAISILRISGKGGVGASEDTAYAGWLEWGAYWPADNGYHRPTCVANNLIVLSDEAFLPGNMFAASHALGAPSLDAAISEATWGKPVASVNKNSYNTTLMEHGGQTPEDVEMDVYFRWDADNLYIGVKTPDGDLTGYRENYVGDGLQFKLEAGKTLTGAASDICLTWGSNSFDPTVGGESFKVRGANDAALNASIRFNEVYEDGALSLMLAIPHKDMGYTAAEVKAGAPYAISILRISGKGGVGASEDTAYAGWLEWGAYWPADNGYHRPTCVANNVIVLSDEAFTPGNVVAAERTSAEVDISRPISTAVWGAPVISVDKNSYNAGLRRHNADPEDVKMDLYFRWDADNLYIGVKTPDSDLTGYKENYVGDGLQFKLEAGKAISGAASDICLTWGQNSFDATPGGASFQVRGANATALNASIRSNIIYESGVLNLMLAIPHKDMGYTAAEVKAGAPYAITMLRISGRDGAGASEERAYSGWLEWGSYWPMDHALHHPNCTSGNTIVLTDKNAGGSSGGDTPVQISNMLDITAGVAGIVAQEGVNVSMKVAQSGGSTYVTYLTADSLFSSTRSSYKALNEFTLYKVSKDAAAYVGKGYTRQGDVDLIAGRNGDVYVVGGSSDRIIREQARYGYDPSREKAVLQLWHYSDRTGVVNGRTTQIDFPSPKGYRYLTAVMSADGGSIYSFYTSGDSLVWYIYSVSTQQWIPSAFSAKLSGAVVSSYVFNNLSGISMVYGTTSGIYQLALQGGSQQTLASGAVTLLDAYVDQRGQLTYLYSDGAAVRLAGAVSGEVSSMKPGDYGRLAVTRNGGLRVLTMAAGEAATVHIIDAANRQVLKSVVLDSAIVPLVAPMVETQRNGSAADGVIGLLFPATYRTSIHWHYAEIALD